MTFAGRSPRLCLLSVWRKRGQEKTRDRLQYWLLMARLARVVAMGVPHHVAQRGNDRQIVFETDPDRARCSEALRYHGQQQHISLLGYCLMSNHVHLIAVPHGPTALARGLAAPTMTTHEISTGASTAAATRGRTVSIPVRAGIGFLPPYFVQVRKAAPDRLWPQPRCPEERHPLP
jgi:hypothetical protein